MPGPRTSTAWAARQLHRQRLPIASSVIILSLTRSAPLLLHGRARWGIRPCQVASLCSTISCTFWADSRYRLQRPLTRFGSLLPQPTSGCKRPLCCLWRAPTYRPPPLVASSTPAVGPMFRAACLLIPLIPLDMIRRLTPLSPLPTYHGLPARPGH